MSSPGPSPLEPSPPTPLQLILFTLLPLVVMALLGEIYLRSAEVLGPSPQLEETSAGLVVPSPIKEGPHLIQGLNDIQFPAIKPASGLRIVLLGGSSTYGFPYQPHSSISLFMERRLKMALPHTPIDVINLGFVSADSFRLSELGRESLDYDPDAIVIYAGHNEYLHFEFSQYEHYRQAPEPAGPLWLKGALWWMAEGSHLFRWGRFLVTDVRQGMVAKAAAKEGVAPRSLYDRRRRVLGNESGRDAQADPELERVESTFRARLEALIKDAHSAHVPVILASPLADYIGFAPSTLSATIDPSDPPEGAHHRAYRRGQELVDQGDLNGAYEAFITANDLDPYPHRIKSWGRRALIELAELPGAYYAPVFETLGAGLPRGLPPQALTVDHVHPSIPGQDAIARVVIDTLINAKILPTEAKAAAHPSTEALMADLDLGPAREWIWNQRLAHYLAHSGDREPAEDVLVETLLRGGVKDVALAQAYSEVVILGALGEDDLRKRRHLEGAARFGAEWEAVAQGYPEMAPERPEDP